MAARLDILPIELLYEVQLFALSETLPYVNRRTYEIFRATHSSFRSEYIMGRFHSQSSSIHGEKDPITYALQFPLCSTDVLDSVVTYLVTTRQSGISAPRLPKHLFRSLNQKNTPWTRDDFPLPFLRHLYNNKRIRSPDPNSYDGYALSRAVHAGCIPLVSFLLKHGASPRLKENLAVRVAIRKKNIGLLRLLIERDESTPTSDSAGEREGGGKGVGGDNRKTHGRGLKRRRLEDRVEVTTAMLKLAVEVDARDIAEYLLDKGARPDMKTIQRMAARGF